MLDNSASFTLSRMKDLCQKWKVKLIFGGAWYSLTALPDWPWPPYFTRDLRHWWYSEYVDDDDDDDEVDVCRQHSNNCRVIGRRRSHLNRSHFCISIRQVSFTTHSFCVTSTCILDFRFHYRYIAYNINYEHFKTLSTRKLPQFRKEIARQHSCHWKFWPGQVGGVVDRVKDFLTSSLITLQNLVATSHAVRARV